MLKKTVFVVAFLLIFTCPSIYPQENRCKGMTWIVLAQKGNYVHVSKDKKTDPYKGDTPISKKLPILAINKNGIRRPNLSGVEYSYYEGWCHGQLKLTPPINGSELTSLDKANDIVKKYLGPDYKMAEFHDGGGGWGYWGQGNLPLNQRVWVSIKDQKANPWNSCKLPPLDHNQKFFEALEQGAIKMVKKALKKGAQINAADHNGKPALIMLAKQYKPELVTFLIEKGASLDIQDKDLMTPLIHAAQVGNLEYVHLLVEKGANIEARDKSGRSALAIAVKKGQREIVKLLIQKGAEVNTKDGLHDSVLMDAMDKRHEDLVNLLIDAGADVKFRNQDGYSVLMSAVRECSLELIKSLITAGADINDRDNNGQTVLMYAAFYNTPDVIQFLIDRGLDVDARDKFGNNAIANSVVYGRLAVHKLLIDSGAKFDYQDKSGMTPLMNAAVAGNLELMKLLVEKGADIHVRDNSKRILLMAAMEGGHRDVVEYVLDLGADLDARDMLGNDLWWYASSYPEFIDMLNKKKSEMKQLPITINRSSSQKNTYKSNPYTHLEDKGTGGHAFSTYNWDFAPYLYKLKALISKNIHPPSDFTTLGLISGATLLRFKIFPDGELKDLEILDFTGHRSLLETSKKSILASAPFPILPNDFPDPYLQVTSKFIYRNNKNSDNKQ